MKQRQQFAARVAVHLACWLPALVLLVQVIVSNGQILGANPVESLTHFSGQWALSLLIVTLTITPLKTWCGLQQLTRYRRATGLYSFTYGSIHLLIYLVFDLSFLFSLLGEDLLKRPYIAVGFSAWLLLLPLAITSTKGWQRRLKRRWKKLHKLIYPAALLVASHFLMQPKSFDPEPVIYAAVILTLLALRWSRLIYWWRQYGIRQ